MEKITQTSVSSNASTVIMDLSKNIASSKSYAKNNYSFKDYINTTNSSQKNDKIQNEVKNDDKKQTIHDGNNMGKMSAKKDIQNSNEKKEEDIEAGNPQNSIKGNEKEQNKLLEKVEKEEIIKDEDVDIIEDMDLENIQNILSTIIDLSNNSNKLNEELQKIPEEMIQDIKNVLENLPQISKDVKDKLVNILKKVEEDNNEGNFLISEFFNEEDISQIKKLKDYFDKEILNKKENVVNLEIKDNVKVSEVDIGKELNSLKNDFEFSNNLKNNTQSIYENKMIENSQDEVYAFSDNVNNNIKIFGNNGKIFSEIRNSTMNPEQIQNFSKIVEEMKIAFRDNKTTLNIKLEPETLGKLSIKIHSENGVLSASFFVESDKAKQAIENQIQLLRQALSDQNINIQDINVQVGQNNEDLNYHKNIMEAINFSKRDSLQEISEEFKSSVNPYLQDDLFNDLI